jgi:hypothetical protein
MNDSRGIKSLLEAVPMLPVLQTGEIFIGGVTWAFSPGYHMTGFQPGDRQARNRINSGGEANGAGLTDR